MGTRLTTVLTLEKYLAVTTILLSPILKPFLFFIFIFNFSFISTHFLFLTTPINTVWNRLYRGIHLQIEYYSAKMWIFLPNQMFSTNCQAWCTLYSYIQCAVNTWLKFQQGFLLLADKTFAVVFQRHSWIPSICRLFLNGIDNAFTVRKLSISCKDYSLSWLIVQLRKYLPFWTVYGIPSSILFILFLIFTYSFFLFLFLGYYLFLFINAMADS